ncbi:hypothetical protein L202_06863 [Cryptococcus amylolentus CBS 6039]|uniref:Uncharacterized protein n=2 Tax=Cryptococcus amylolentus TaxID=104669 RepID=A0A1E3HDQ8_9TREE|nr:hypothetical protein L202_06863 [Cryptococcus amylolentus CBS 6039]ODN74479.1 hypothetical protein L202_06863 [Cryptococcus amylolentus CBS 6039]ODO01468.1 hypothetical protein I350_06288 [Cryptococcus amylolentus CBS 6273]
MSLSSSTLSLKFMQRGKAPAGNATPSKNTNKAGQHPTPSASAGPSTSNSPAPASLITPNSTDRPEEVSQTLAREEAAKWYIPRPNKPATAGAAASKKGDVRVEYEASYAPFLPGFDDQDSGEEDEDAGKSTAGGGRMVFGGFGKPKGKEKAEDGDEEDAAMDSDEEEVQDKRAKPRVEKGKSFAKDKREQKVPPAQQPPKTFLRPAMSPPPSNPKPSSSRPKSSTQNVSSLKQEPNTAISSKKQKAPKRPAPPESPQTSFTGSGAGAKKAKTEPEGGKQKVKKEKSGGGGSLDDREKMMKAQKKVEKRKAKAAKGL